MVNKKIDEKEAMEVKKIYKQYIDKRYEITKNTQFKVEDVFGDVFPKYSISTEQKTKKIPF